MNLKQFNVILLLLLLYGIQFSVAADTPQTYSVTFHVKSVVPDDNLKGIPVKLVHKDYGLNYPVSYLSATGECIFTEVVEGIHSLTIDASNLGLIVYNDENLNITQNGTIDITLQEAVTTPYALKAEEMHDVHTGQNDIILNWNNETDYYFDDFESYDAFSIDFAPWTGIDGDKDPAAQISGAYPNSGIPQYATIFNPLVITPPVWYEYPVMRPYSGKQYVGFIRTQSGTANNDWLISKKLTIGVNNVVRFMAKAADRFKEQFKVGISTTGTEMQDFTFLTPGNYETVDYKSWKTIEYDLSAYQGKEVYITIQYVSKNYFMLMIDDFYVGPKHIDPSKVKRKAMRSAANPVEKFELFCDGTSVGTTEETSFKFENLQAGAHTLEVQAVYRVSRSDKTPLDINVKDDSHYATVQANVTTNNQTSANGLTVNYINTGTGKQIDDIVTEGISRLPSLEKGNYLINISADGYENYSTELALEEDKTIDITLIEKIVKPFNITTDYTPAATAGKSDVLLKWNQDLGFTDSFEEYANFSQTFGEWTTIDKDGLPPYGVSLNGTQIDFPGNNKPSPCMIFNPLATTPSMEADGAMLAPFGDKYVAFFSAQQGQSNDWLISPRITVREGYVLRFVAKSYDPMYTETIRILISESKETDTFDVLDEITIPASEWNQFEVNLSAYAGKQIYLAFNYISIDKFLLQLDMFYVGPGENSDNSGTNAGNVTYEISLDGVVKGTTEQNNYTFEGLTNGKTYTAGIKAIYVSGESEIAEYQFTCISGSAIEKVESNNIIVSGDEGIIHIQTNENAYKVAVYDITGKMITEETANGNTVSVATGKGIYILEVTTANQTLKQKVTVK